MQREPSAPWQQTRLSLVSVLSFSKKDWLGTCPIHSSGTECFQAPGLQIYADFSFFVKEFAVCTPKGASYLLGCLRTYVRHHRQQEVEASILEKLHGVLKPTSRQEHLLNDAPNRNEPFTALLPKIPWLRISTGL